MLTAPTILQAVPLADYQAVAAQLDVERAEKAALVARVRALEDAVIDVAAAMESTGLSRTALYQEARRPDTLLVRVQNGRSVGFTRASCVVYRQAKELGRHRSAR